MSIRNYLKNPILLYKHYQFRKQAKSIAYQQSMIFKYECKPLSSQDVKALEKSSFEYLMGAYLRQISVKKSYNVYLESISSEKIVVSTYIWQDVKINILVNKKDTYYPPRKIHAILKFILPVSIQEGFIGDIEEQFLDICEECGKPTAVRWYIWQLIWSGLPIVVAQCAKVCTALGGIVGLPKILSWLHKFIY